MKKMIVIISLMLVSLTLSANKDWKGRVVDQNGEPVAYANVAVL